MGDMLVSLDVSNEHLSLAHSISAILSDIDWSLDGSTKLQLVSFNRNHANQRHLNDQFLGVLVVQAVLFNGPTSTFEVQSLDVGAGVKTLGNLGRVALLGDLSVQKRFVERPLASTAGCLEESGEVGLGNVES